ncbi:hypothetical protein D3C72_1611040 [compost metagenome]
MHAEAVALHAGLGGEVGERLVGGHVLGAAVRIAGVVHGVGAEEQVAAADRLGPAQGQRQHDRVAGRHVGNRNAAGGAVGRHVEGVVGQRGAAEAAQVEVDDLVALRAQRRRHQLRGLQLGRMPLAVAHGQRVGFKPGGVGHGEDGGGVKSARKQDDGAFGHDQGARTARNGGR